MRRMIVLLQAATSRVTEGLATLLRDQRGVSAVEFALIAPILLGGLLSMVDLGLAATERMSLDHVLRAGAQAAMAEKDKERILKVLEATASEHFALGGSVTQTSAENPVVLSVKCICSGENATEEECTACTASPQAHVYYRISAEKLYNGTVFKSLQLTTRIEIQLR